MAQSFSPKKYFQKIHTHEVLADFYETHAITAILGITDSTPRKNAVEIMIDFYKSLPPSQKIDIEKELTLISTLSTKHTIPLFNTVFKHKKIAVPETKNECKTDQDRILYYYLHHRDIFDEILFFHDFYSSRGYMLYEAKEVTLESAEFAITELTKEFKRIANKEDRATECILTAKSLDGLLYVHGVFDGVSELNPERNKETGELDRTKTRRRQEEIKIVYFPKDNYVIISYTGSRYEKLIFLDTFLRIVCNSHFEDKLQSCDIHAFKDKHFDFSKTNKSIPLLTWKAKSITLSFGSDKAKKKIKISLPGSSQERGLSSLFTTLEELQLEKNFALYNIENILLSFSFQDIQKPEKSTNISCSLSPNKISLCPLFPYDKYAMTLLKQAGIDTGFVEQIKKDTDKVTKKWEE